MTIMDIVLSTAFKKLFGVQHPIALAPMGRSAGGALTAAASRGGGLGLLGAGDGDRWLCRRDVTVQRSDYRFEVAERID